MPTKYKTHLSLLALFLMSNLLLFLPPAAGLALSVGVLLCVGLIVWKKRLLRTFFGWFKGLIVVFVIVFLIQTFTFDGLGYSQDGLELAVYSVARIAALTGMMFVFVHTTRLQYVAQALGFLPFHLGFVMTIAVGMIEQLTREATQIRIAQRARGHRTSWNPVKTYLPLLLPLFSRSLQRAQNQAIALQARGFSLY